MRRQINFKAVVIVLAVFAMCFSYSLDAQFLKLRAPRQISPRNNSHFTHFPRKLTLRWTPVKGAAAYDVEIDCLHCRNSGQWDSQNGLAWKVANNVKGTSHTFNFAGDYKGRWRVRSTRGKIRSRWSRWWSFDFKTKPGSGSSGKRLPDLAVTGIKLVKGCKIAVTIENKGNAGVPPSYYDLPKAVAVQMYNGTKPWGGLILKGVDPTGKLKFPGGKVTHIWFPNAANLNLTPGYHSLKVVVDFHKVLVESNELNNSLTRRVKCQKVGGIVTTQPVGTIATPALTLKAPDRFFIDFNDAYLVYSTNSNSIQIAAQSNVLSYGQDWDKKKLKSYLYHIRLKTWQGFYWAVNTSRKEVYKVTGGTFGQMGGSLKKLPTTVDVVGDPNNPTRFLLRFKNAYLAYIVSSKSIQVIAEAMVLSYGGDWQKCQLKPYLYEIRQNVWKGFYWKINTGKKEAVRIRGAAFCGLGGTYEKLNVGIRVYN